ncbi:HlyD family secretion protein [Paracoccus angustae]|uniref:HlyD family secretion protein n=1 Tax=Paracoccus angustae TaxID=1671480 RepID=A0ABV7U158_9RHOB
MKKENLLPTLVALAIGLAGVLLLLYAWHLPPFRAAEPTTENAYIRGKVTTVAPQVSGYVAAVDVTDFQPVKAGDAIARIDDRIARQKLAQADAQLAAARAAMEAAARAAMEVAAQSVASAEAVVRADRAGVDSARSALTTARTGWNRARELRTRGVASQSAAEQSDLALRQAEAAVTQAEAQLDVQREAVKSARAALQSRRADIASAQAAVELARIELDNTVIRAPADGRLGQVAVRVGQYVTPGTALVSHVGRDVWIIANFKETSLTGLLPGEAVRFTVDAMRHRAFAGRVESFSPATASEYSLLAGTNATGNFTKIAQRLPVRISIDPGQQMAEHLRPGMSVVVHVDTATAPG